MTDSSTLEQMLSEFLPEELRLVVYDPADQWSDVQSHLPDYDLPFRVERRSQPKAGGTIAWVRLDNGPLPQCSLLLSLVPAGGFDGDQRDTIKSCLAECPGTIGHLALVLVDDAELKPSEGERSQTGYQALVEELNREFGTTPLVVPRTSFGSLATRAQRAVEDLARCCHGTIGWSSIGRRLELLGAELVSATPSGTIGFEDAVEILTSGHKSEALLASMVATRRLLRKAEQVRERPEDAWRSLAEDGLDKCAQARKNVKYHGRMAEEIISGIADEIGRICQLLQEDWREPPFKDLAGWRDEALAVLHASDIVFPIVGVFSSGKTTLLNRILGRSPKGRNLLRTSVTHNTALLCRFHLKKPADANRAEFTWREQLSVDLLDYARTNDGRGGRAALNKIRDLQRLYPEGRLRVRSRAIRSVLGFIESGLLEQVRAQVTWRVPPKLSLVPTGLAAIRSRAADRLSGQDSSAGPVLLENQTIRGMTKEFNHLVDVLQRMTGTSEAESDLMCIPNLPGEMVPVRVSLTAQVKHAGERVRQHDLETDEDWDWFQGTVGDDGCFGKRVAGFAESAEAEYLIERCDIYLDNPLFELVSLVDTPGLNSVTEHHDKITEDFIRRGQAFLMMAKLGEAAYQKDSGRILDLMRQALADGGIDEGRSDRVFLVLNWFHSQAGAKSAPEAAKRVAEFVQLAREHLGGKQLRLYVVDLSPAALARAMPLEMLGWPSLQALIRDLKTFIAERGLADRFAVLQRRLATVWDGLQKGTQRQMDELEDEQVGREVERRVKGALARFREPDGLRRELAGMLEEEAKHLLGIHDELARRLITIEDKDDFETFSKEGALLMERFNQLRCRLREDVAREMTARVRRPLRNLVDALPSVRAPKDLIGDVPAMPISTFREAMDREVDNWPGWVSRAVHYVADGFVSWGESRREELQGKFVTAEDRRRLKVPLDKVLKRYRDEVLSVCDKAAAALERRLAETERSASGRRKRAEELVRERMKIEVFSPKVRQMQQLLSRSAKLT